MADNSGAEDSSSRLHEIVRNRRVLWWTGSAVALLALVGMTWLARKRIPFSSLREWVTHSPDWFLPVGLGVGALLALAILWKVPQWQVRPVNDLGPKERFDRVNEARKTLATILGGIAFLVGGFFTWQNLKVAQDAASTSQKALEVSREGQVTDRFSKAIEQLGSAKLQIRLGGIYALEGIANESKELHWPIMEVLCTYVRDSAPRKPEQSSQKNKVSAELAPVAADIQAILTVLGRRDPKYELKGQRLDLGQADIHEANLVGANLSGANLHGANLSGADLDGVNLDGANLSWANLDGADLGGANLRGVDFRWASLADADLSGANVRWANLYMANLRLASLRLTEGLTQEQVDTAVGDVVTLLPKDLHIPVWWNPQFRKNLPRTIPHQE